MRIESSVAALGAGRYDGEKALLLYGSERAPLNWHEGGSTWLGDERVALQIRDIDFMRGINPSQNWNYLANGPPGGQQSWGWCPQSIMRADLAYAAGLKLQENLTALFWHFPAVTVPFKLGMVWYSFAEAGTISVTIMPDDTSPFRNVGVSLPSLFNARHWQTTGWQDSPIDPPFNAHLAPHLYTYRPLAGEDTATRVEHVSALWRWAAEI